MNMHTRTGMADSVENPVPLRPAAETLNIQRISKVYGEVHAVDAVDLSVPRGEFLTLLGPSGSGKTTLLMMIAGFVVPSAGDIYLGERRITDLLPERRNFGMVFQGYALFPHLTVAENVAFPLRARRVGKAEMEKRVRQMLALVRLERFADRRPAQLSGGQQQRVALARAIVFSPDLLLLDEPLSALDKRLRGDLQAELRQLHRQVGRTFVNVTHDQEEALTMSDRVAIMRDGRVVQVGAPGELYERPATRFVADFLGKSNFLRATVEEAAGGEFRYALGGGRFTQRQPATALPKGASVLLALRPEKITLHAARPENEPNALTGEIVSTSYTGASHHLVIRTVDAGDIILTAATWRADVTPTVGAKVWVAWSANAAVIVADD
jgi:putative spermidine/putrescine transport system ATP-binding protein